MFLFQHIIQSQWHPQWQLDSVYTQMYRYIYSQSSQHPQRHPESLYITRLILKFIDRDVILTSNSAPIVLSFEFWVFSLKFSVFSSNNLSLSQKIGPPSANNLHAVPRIKVVEPIGNTFTSFGITYRHIQYNTYSSTPTGRPEDWRIFCIYVFSHGELDLTKRRCSSSRASARFAIATDAPLVQWL